jgi:Domain of unknown function (DUF4388)
VSVAEAPSETARDAREPGAAASAPDDALAGARGLADEALRGDLARFSGLDVLQFLKLAGATGVAEFERNGELLRVTFASGRPLAATTTGRSVRIGEALIERGAASLDQVCDALAEQREGAGRSLGELLRARGVAEEQVCAAAAEVFRRLLVVLALWPDGRFRFAPGPAADGDDAALDLELDRVILEGLHTADPYPAPA